MDVGEEGRGVILASGFPTATSAAYRVTYGGMGDVVGGNHALPWGVLAAIVGKGVHHKPLTLISRFKS